MATSSVCSELLTAVLLAALVLGAAAGPARAADETETVHAVIVGRQADPSTRALLDAAASAGRPDVVVTFYDIDAGTPPTVPSSVAGLLRDARVRARDRAVGYVCTESQCSLPLTDASSLRRVIRQYSPGR